MDVNSHMMIHQYRNVVYLNNASTAFMEREEYQQAILSLKDALFLLETIVRPVASSFLKTSPTKDIDFRRRVNDMFLHLSTPFILDTQIKVNRVTQLLACCKSPTISSLFKIDVVCYDGSIDSSFSLAEKQLNLSSEQRVLAIQISDFLVDGRIDLYEMYTNITEIVPAIILSNYASAHFCVFKVTNNCNALNRAIRLYHLSTNVLCIREKLQIFSIDDPNADHDDKFMYFSEGSLFVSLVISLNIQYMPVEAAIKCGSDSPTSSNVLQDASSCAIVRDLYALRRFAAE
jgi:hypothetical protein